MLVGGALTLAAAQYFATRVYDEWLYDSAMALASQIKPDGTGSVVTLPAAAVEMLEYDQTDRVLYDVVAASGEHVFGNQHLPPPPRAPGARPVFYDGVVDGDPVRLTAVAVAVPAPAGDIVIVAETLTKRRGIVTQILAGILPIEIALLAIAGVLIWFAVTSALRRVNRLAVELGHIQTDDLAPLAEVDVLPAEIRPLAEALNGVMDRLAEARDAVRRFVANAAHQLRTPLAAMQIQVQRALRETDAVRRQEALSAVDKAMVRLTRVTQQLLTLARAEPGSGDGANIQSVDLAALARQELEHWADAAVARGIDLGYDGPAVGPLILGDPQLLTDLVANLVDNAIRYSDGEGQVTLRLSADPVVLSVEDTGPGIAPAERERVLERFYRPPASKGTGSGLGLAIASEIAKRHGARLTLGAGEGGKGTLATVAFEAIPVPSRAMERV